MANAHNSASIPTCRVHATIQYSLSLQWRRCLYTFLGHRLDIHPTNTPIRTTLLRLPRVFEDRITSAPVYAAQVPTHLPSALRPHRLHHDTDLRAPHWVPRHWARAWGTAHARGGRGPTGHPRSQGSCPQPALLHATGAEARVCGR